MGALRLFLALSVIVGHAEGAKVFGFYGVGSLYAVQCFFVISGFYMAMVLNEKYRENELFRFYKSRMLRLLPIYYVGIVISIFLWHERIHSLLTNLSFWGQALFYFQNIFIFSQDVIYVFCIKLINNQCAPSLYWTINPPAWSLGIELTFYLLAPFIVRSVKCSYFFLLIGCLYLISIGLIKFPVADIWGMQKNLSEMQLNYNFFPSSFIFFASGVLAYHFYRRRNLRITEYIAAGIAILLLAFTNTVMPYWHLILFSLSVPFIFKMTAHIKIDRIIGDLSYPVYILHFPLLSIIKSLEQQHPEYFSVLGRGDWAAIISMSLGLGLVMFLERPIDRFRHLKENKLDQGVLVGEPTQVR